MKKFLIPAMLLLTSTYAQAQCGPYGQYPCAPRPYYAPPRYIADEPKPPLQSPGMPPARVWECPECGPMR